MKVRLIKAGTSPPVKMKPPPGAGEIGDTLRSWVNEFKSDKANRPRLAFPGTRKSGEAQNAVGRDIETESDTLIG